MKIRFLLGAALALALVACGDDETTDATATVTTVSAGGAGGTTVSAGGMGGAGATGGTGGVTGVGGSTGVPLAAPVTRMTLPSTERLSLVIRVILVLVLLALRVMSFRPPLTIARESKRR